MYSKPQLMDWYVFQPNKEKEIRVNYDSINRTKTNAACNYSWALEMSDVSKGEVFLSS